MSDGPAIPAFGARQAMPVEGFLERASSVSLDHFASVAEGAEAFQRTLARNREQICALAAEMLEPARRPLLEWLCDLTLRRPMILPNLGPEAVPFVALREGQNQIVYQLLRAAAEGRSEQIEPREGA